MKEVGNMRKGYKISILLMLSVLLITLSACDYSYELYQSNTRNGEEVIKIELISYDEDTVNLELDPGYFSEADLVELETLPDDDYDKFLEGLSEIGGFSGKFENVSDFPDGVGVLLTYADDGMTVITVNSDLDRIFVGNYDSDINLEMYYCIYWEDMIVDFVEVVNEYFTNGFEVEE